MGVSRELSNHSGTGPHFETAFLRWLEPTGRPCHLASTIHRQWMQARRLLATVVVVRKLSKHHESKRLTEPDGVVSSHRMSGLPGVLNATKKAIRKWATTCEVPPR
jgi:hypothetical protein